MLHNSLRDQRVLQEFFGMQIVGIIFNVPLAAIPLPQGISQLEVKRRMLASFGLLLTLYRLAKILSYSGPIRYSAMFIDQTSSLKSKIRQIGFNPIRTKDQLRELESNFPNLERIQLQWEPKASSPLRRLPLVSSPTSSQWLAGTSLRFVRELHIIGESDLSYQLLETIAQNWPHLR